MLKKISALIVLFTAIVFSTTNIQTVEAAEIYVGSYSDGSDVYLITESINIESRSPYAFNCTVRAGKYDYLRYEFFPYNRSPYYRNSEGYEGYVFEGASPVARRIYNYVKENY